MGIKFDKQAFNTGFAAGARGAEKYRDRKVKEDAAVIKYNQQVERDKVTDKLAQDKLDIQTNAALQKTTIAINRAAEDREKTTDVNAYNVGSKSINALTGDNNQEMLVPVTMLDVDGNSHNINIPLSGAAAYKKEPDNYVYGKNGNVMIKEIGEDDKYTGNVADSGILGRKFGGDDGKPTGFTKRTFDSYTPSEQKKLSLAGYKSGDEITNNIAKTYLDEPTKDSAAGKTQWAIDPDTKKSRLYPESEVISRGLEKSFKPSERKTTWSNLKVQAYEEYAEKATANNETIVDPSTWEEDNKRRGNVKDVSDLRKYGATVLSGEVKYDEDTARNNQVTFENLSKSYDKKEEQKFEAKVNSIDSLNTLKSGIEKGMEDGTYSGNAVMDTIKGAVTKYIPDDYNTMDEADQTKAYDRLMNDSSINAAVAQYLKDMSGTAASEAEALRTLRAMMGGGSMTNIKVRAGSLNRFIDDRTRKVRGEAKSMYAKGYQHTAGKFLYGGESKEVDLATFGF